MATDQSGPGAQVPGQYPDAGPICLTFNILFRVAREMPWLRSRWQPGDGNQHQYFPLTGKLYCMRRDHSAEAAIANTQMEGLQDVCSPGDRQLFHFGFMRALANNAGSSGGGNINVQHTCC